MLEPLDKKERIKNINRFCWMPELKQGILGDMVLLFKEVMY